MEAMGEAISLSNKKRQKDTAQGLKPARNPGSQNRDPGQPA
jgi:hypothetical protein